MSVTRRVALGPTYFLPRRGFVVVPIVPSFPMANGTVARSALVGAVNGRLVAYANLCRHLAVPLDLHDGNVMDDHGGKLVCHRHGAIFEPATGECIAGPCEGQSLYPFSVETEGDEAVLVLTGGKA